MKKISSILLLLCLVYSISFAQKNNYNLIVGTYTTPGKSEGIYTYNFNTLTGKSSLKSITKNIDNPSYLTLSPNKEFAYVVNERGKNSAVSSFKYNSTTGELHFINKVASGGADPCFIIADDKNVLVANYSGGNLAVFSRKADGSLSEAIQVVQHTGSSTDPKGRQKNAHVHQVLFTPDHKYIVSNDLGEDHIYIYNYHPNKKEVLSVKSIIKTTPATGPRHITFSPNGKFAYLTHEFNGSITAFTYTNGNLNKIQTIATTPKDFEGKIDGADIHVSADGKFLYETNRGDANTISTFSISKKGTLKFIETISTLGKGPRNFTIDPSGQFLLIAHQSSNDVIIFNRDKKTGKLTNSGQKIEVGAPVCLVFDK